MSPRGGSVVIGLGNVICSDDGVGVHALARLRGTRRVPEAVTLVEGGTAGLLLLPYLADAERVILLDAIDIGADPGTLVELDGADWASAFALHMTPHDVGLADLLGAAQLCGAWPPQLTICGVQPGSIELGTALTPSVAAALDGLVDQVIAQLVSWGAATVVLSGGVG
jgi:hydrogenase maturation protease